jgi:hypothetical protein
MALLDPDIFSIKQVWNDFDATLSNVKGISSRKGTAGLLNFKKGF